MSILFLCTVITCLVCAVSGQIGPICYSCTGVYDVIDCHDVERCSYGHACFIEKDPSHNAKLNLGCRDAGVCNSVTTDTTCTPCCQGDLCNGKGRDIREIPQPRGPVCYSCNDQETPQNCTHVEQCSYGEVCELSRIRLGNNVTFVTKCVNKNFCPSTESYVLGKRGGRTTECLQCCSGDLCNHIECTSVYGTQNPTLASVSTRTSSKPTHISTVPRPIDGIFGEWSSWTRCPYTCGRDGIQHRFRHCINPPRQNGGSSCDGSMIDTKFCHNVPCCSGPPVITFIDKDVRAKAGDFVTLHCTATHADSLHWEVPKIIGRKLPENVEVLSGLNLLVVSNIAYNNTGAYRCIAQNLCGTTTKYVNVDLSN